MPLPLALLLGCFLLSRCSALGMSALFFKPAGRIPVALRALMLFAPLSYAVEGAIVYRAQVRVPEMVAGAFFYCGSWGLFLAALWANRKHRLSPIYSDDVPCHMVASGPYRFVRHPFYLSYLVASAGAVIASRTTMSAMLFAVNLTIYWAAARAEERKFARSPFADQYSRYVAVTGMLLPRVFRSRGMSGKANGDAA